MLCRHSHPFFSGKPAFWYQKTHCGWAEIPTMPMGQMVSLFNARTQRQRYLFSLRIASTTHHMRDFCNSSIPVSSSDAGHRLNFVVPSHGCWFACTTGLKPCINLASTTDLWILVNLLPQVYYFSGGGGGWEHIFPRGRYPRTSEQFSSQPYSGMG